MSSSFLKKLLLISLVLSAVSVAGGSPAWSSALEIQAVWNASGPSQELSLKTFGEADLGRLKKLSLQEKDPVSGKLLQWNGVLLSDLVEKALDALPLDKKAQVDLIVLKNAKGEQAMIPRYLITKFPLLLSIQQNDRSPACVVPWTSRPRIWDEDLPLQSYFVPEVNRIELASSRDRFGALYLKRRTDPSAMRGERMFVKNCVSCHAPSQPQPLNRLSNETAVERLQRMGHPSSTKLGVKIAEHDRRYLVNYLEAYRMENLQAEQAAVSNPRTRTVSQ